MTVYSFYNLEDYFTRCPLDWESDQYMVLFLLCLDLLNMEQGLWRESYLSPFHPMAHTERFCFHSSHIALVLSWVLGLPWRDGGQKSCKLLLWGGASCERSSQQNLSPPQHPSMGQLWATVSQWAPGATWLLCKTRNLPPSYNYFLKYFHVLFSWFYDFMPLVDLGFYGVRYCRDVIKWSVVIWVYQHRLLSDLLFLY